MAILGDLEIMQAEIDVDDIPFIGAVDGEPFVDLGEAIGGGATVLGDAMDVGFAFEEFAEGQGIAHGNGVADDQDAGQAGHIGDVGEDGVGLGGFLILGRGDERKSQQEKRAEPFHVGEPFNGILTQAAL